MGTRSPKRRFDLRLPIGIALVVGSVVGVVTLVVSLDRTTTAWAAPHDLVAGDVVSLGDLQPRPVRLDLVEGAYLVGELDPESALVVLRPIGAGELVPLGAVGDVATIDSAVVVVPIDGPLASGLLPGASADVWAAAPTEGGGYAAPVVIATGAQVGRVIEASGLVATGGIAVEVVVPRNRVARLLEAIADGAAISLVPALPAVSAPGDEAPPGTAPTPTPAPTAPGG